MNPHMHEHMNPEMNDDMNPPMGGRGPHGGGPRRGGPHHGGPHHGPHGRGPGRGRGRQRGDVRTAILLLLAEEPMHGYQLMQTINERSSGRWNPSPGAIYPTLSALADEGLATLTESEGRKLASLTEAGRAHVEENRESWRDPFQGDAEDAGPDLHRLTRDLMDAVRHAAMTGTEAQRTRVAAALTTARTSVYRILADTTEE